MGGSCPTSPPWVPTRLICKVQNNVDRYGFWCRQEIIPFFDFDVRDINCNMKTSTICIGLVQGLQHGVQITPYFLMGTLVILSWWTVLLLTFWNRAHSLHSSRREAVCPHRWSVVIIRADYYNEVALPLSDNTGALSEAVRELVKSLVY